MLARILVIFAAFGAGCVASEQPPERRHFTGTYEFDPSPEQNLDVAPLVWQSRPFRCPSELRGEAREAIMHALVWAGRDGGVTRVLVTHGEDIRFRDSVHAALSGWKFILPVKDGRTVDALLSVSLKVSGKGITQVKVELPQKPNQPPEPMVMSVTSPACAGAAPATTMAHL